MTGVSDDAIQAYFKQVWLSFLTDILRVLSFDSPARSLPQNESR
jgi:hypothetical protein